MTDAGRDEQFQAKVRRRVRIADLIREPLEIELPDGRSAVVSDIGVDDMIRLFEIEGRVETAAGGEELRLMADSRDFVCELIERDNPGVWDSLEDDPENPGEKVAVRRMPNWPLQVVMGLTGVLAGDDSAAEAVRRSLLGDPEEQEAERELAEQERAARLERGEEVEDDREAPDPDDPLTLTQPSQTPSSNSGATSGGDRSGGSTPAAPGEFSERTSDISGVVV